MKKLNEFDSLLSDLERKLEVRANFLPYLEAEQNINRVEFDKQTKRVIFRAMLQEAYCFGGFGNIVRIPTVDHQGSVFTSAQITNSSTCDPLFSEEPMLFCTGRVRVITPKRGYPFAVLESVTGYTGEDVKDLIGYFGRSALKKIAGEFTPLSLYLNGPTPPRGGRSSSFSEQNESEYTIGDIVRNALHTPVQDADLVEEEADDKAEPSEKSKRLGTFGALLSQALKA
jgi:hypothetical protein